MASLSGGLTVKGAGCRHTSHPSVLWASSVAAWEQMTVLGLAYEALIAQAEALVWPGPSQAQSTASADTEGLCLEVDSSAQQK
mmetsp:Transcript_32531/g.58362  ORF Transcript_32531/g.58362 Transcript_32531/m.58362 type:complete len:83 (+) Transcript_32531:891-1139(+)